MKNQDELIKIAKSAGATDFPFSDSKLASILDNVDSANPTPPAKLKGKTKMSAIGITLIGLIIGALTMNPLANKENIESKNSQNEIVKQEIALNKPSGNTSNSNTQFETKAQAITKGLSETPKTQDSIEEDLHLPNSAFIDLAPTSKEKHYIPAIVLSKEELRKLYVYFDDDGLFYIDESIYPPYEFRSDDAEKELLLKGYPAKGSLKQLKSLFTSKFYPLLLPYDNSEMSKSLGIYPLQVFTLSKDQKYKAGHLADYPVIENPISKFEAYKYFDNCNSLLKDRFNNAELFISTNVFYFNLNDSLYNYLKNYRLVFVPEIKNSLTKLALFFFPATSNLHSLLPDRYKGFVDKDSIYGKNYLRADKSVITTKMNSYLSNIARFKQLSDSINNAPIVPPIIQKNIAGIGKLKLTVSELAKLGVDYSNGTLNFPVEEKIYTKSYDKGELNTLINKYSYKVDGDYILRKYNINYNFCNYLFGGSTTNKYTGWNLNDYSKTAPVGLWSRSVFSRKEKNDTNLSKISIVRGYMFQSPLMLDLYKSEYIDSHKFLTSSGSGTATDKPIISRMIQIDFQESCNESNIDEYPKVILYYYVNREFIELLPERYKTPLSKELDVLEQIESGELPAEDACKAIKGQESYMGVCSITASNIVSANVYPNPVSRESFSAGVIVRKEANISVDLYNSTGDLVKRLLENIHLQGGINSIKFENALHGIAPGMYILSFVQDNGERVTRNIIIR